MSGLFFEEILSLVPNFALLLAIFFNVQLPMERVELFILV